MLGRSLEIGDFEMWPNRIEAVGANRGRHGAFALVKWRPDYNNAIKWVSG